MMQCSCLAAHRVSGPLECFNSSRGESTILQHAGQTASVQVCRFSSSDHPSVFLRPPSNWIRSISLERKLWLRGYLSNKSLITFTTQVTPNSDAAPSNQGRKKDGLWWKYVLEKGTLRREEITANLRRYGLAGVLAYGLLNTVYYLGTLLIVWFHVAPSPGGLGVMPAAKRFMQVFAMVWAGSQVTKLLRAAGALALAPAVDKGLNWYTQHFSFQSREKAFGSLVGACIALALLVFIVITILWA